MLLKFIELGWGMPPYHPEVRSKLNTTLSMWDGRMQ